MSFLVLKRISGNSEAKKYWFSLEFPLFVTKNDISVTPLGWLLLRTRRYFYKKNIKILKNLPLNVSLCKTVNALPSKLIISKFFAFTKRSALISWIFCPRAHNHFTFGNLVKTSAGIEWIVDDQNPTDLTELASKVEGSVFIETASLGPIATSEKSHAGWPSSIVFLHVIVVSAKVLAKNKHKIASKKLLFIFILLTSLISTKYVSQTDLNFVSIGDYIASHSNHYSDKDNKKKFIKHLILMTMNLCVIIECRHWEGLKIVRPMMRL